MDGFFYINRMDLYKEFFKITKMLNKAKISYAVIGGIAMGFYVKPRFTKDIDIVVNPKQFDKLKEALLKISYEETAQQWSFLKSGANIHRFIRIIGERTMQLDVLVGYDTLHENVLANARKVKSNHGVVRIADIADIVRLKSFRSSDQDIVDISQLKALR